MGLTVTLGRKRIDSASVVGDDKLVRVTKESNVVPRVLLETHYLFTTNPFRPTAKAAGGTTFNVANAQRENCKSDENACPTYGIGPFVGIQQTSDGSSFSALALGLAMGFRPGSKAGVTFGIGAMFDSSAKVLGSGIQEGHPLPKGETDVRLKEKGQISPVISVALSF